MTSSPKRGLPLVDRNTGGSQLQYPDSLKRAHAGIRNVDTIITGHMSAQATFDDWKMFADLNQEFVTWARAQLAESVH